MEKKKEFKDEIDDIIARIDARIKELEEDGKAKVKETVEEIPNIDDLIQKIEKKIADLENKEKDNDSYFDKLVKQIDVKMETLEKKKEACCKDIDLDKLTDKINAKLSELDDNFNDELDKTIYDLSEISKTINNMIEDLEKKRKEKKRKKAMYCNLARKKQRKNQK